MKERAFRLGIETEQPEIAVEDVPVRGRIPAWLEGTLVRNGPGTFDGGNKRLNHWFDGFAMLHRFSFAGGRVSYQNKMLDSRAYRAVRETGTMQYTEFATDPCRSWFQRVQGFMSATPGDNAKVSIDKIAGRAMALGETPLQVEFDPQSLETVGVVNYDPGLLGRMTTAHPHHDAQGAYNLILKYSAISHYNFFRLGAGTAEKVASAPVRTPAYLHSFGMTPRYFVIAEYPFQVIPAVLLLWLRPYIENFTWQPEKGTRWLFIDRATGRLAHVAHTEAMFAFHHVNAFDDGEEVVADLVAYDDASIIEHYYLNRLALPDAQIPQGQLRRYRFNLARNAAAGRAISPVGIELPHIDYERYNMRADQRFTYGIGVREGARDFYNQIVKIDSASGEHQVWHEADAYPGEPVFVARPGAAGEDDGVLLSVVLDAAAGNSYLLALDGATLEEVGRATLPQPVTFGFHGAFLETNQPPGGPSLVSRTPEQRAEPPGGSGTER